ncbi:hypothetical protein ACS0TY_003725 [Phlomoides rotata]
MGGKPHRTTHMEDFRNTVSDLELQDLGFSGNSFTWTNGRTGINNIQERIDRAFANPRWRLLFRDA